VELPIAEVLEMIQSEREIFLGDNKIPPSLVAPDLSLEHLTLYKDKDMKFFEKIGEGIPVKFFFWKKYLDFLRN
jgi:hypothetical protein